MSMLVLLIAIALPANAFAGFFDSVKKAAGVKADEKVEIGLKELCPRLASYADTKYDPYKEKKLEYTKVNVAQVDDFSLKMVKLRGTLEASTVISKGTADEITTGGYDNDAMVKRITELTDVLTALGSEAPAVVTSGQDLATNLPSILAGPNAMKIESITKSVKSSIEEAIALPEKAKALVTDLTNLSKVLAENAEKIAKDTAAGAVENAKAQVEGAVEKAIETVEDVKAQAEGAVDKAKDAAAEAKDKAGEAVDKAKEGAAKAGEAAKDAGEKVKEGAEKVEEVSKK